MTFLTTAPGNYPCDNNSSEATHEIFIAALLLTGSEVRAEEVVLEAIRTVERGAVSASTVFKATIRIAARQQMMVDEERSWEQEPPVSWLPFELRRVLLLPRNERHIFVLRILLGLSRSECSRLLQLEESELDQHIVSAVLTLARITAQESEAPGTLYAVALSGAAV